MKGTGWVGLELSVILAQTVGRLDMWVTPYTGISIHWQRWNISYLKTWVLRNYKVALLLITQGDIQSIEQEILSAKVKPDMPIQNFD